MAAFLPNGNISFDNDSAVFDRVPAPRFLINSICISAVTVILGIFITKYAAGVALAMQPDLKANANFVLAIATLYGVFSGIFAGRTVRLLHLAMRPAAHPVPVLNA